jgi:hypothetical protein
VTWSALWSSIYIFSLLSDFIFFVLICLAIYVFLAQELAQSSSDKVAELKMLLETESNRRKEAEEEMTRLKWQLEKYTPPEVSFF